MGTIVSPIRELEGETRDLSTTEDYIAVEPNFMEAKMCCEGAWRLAVSPKLVNCLYYNASAGTYTSYRTEATDKLTTTHVPLDGMVKDGDYLYLGFSSPALGVYVNMGSNVNANAVLLDIEYCSTAVALGATIAFTDVSGDSDGTLSGSTTLAQDGVITWTLPTAWKESTLGTHALPTYEKCYWLRLTPSDTNNLSATVDILGLIPVYKNTSYGYMRAGVEYQFSFNTSAVGGFVVKATAGTPALTTSWIRH